MEIIAVIIFYAIIIGALAWLFVVLFPYILAALGIGLGIFACIGIVLGIVWLFSRNSEAKKIKNKELEKAINDLQLAVIDDFTDYSKIKDDSECAIYARSIALGLPKMPYTDTDSGYNSRIKANIINAHQPTEMAVAIMPKAGFYGHVAVVKSVNQDGTITITEANYVDHKITERTGTPEQLGIEGYWTNIIEKINAE